MVVGAKMKKILQYLASNGLFLLTEQGYRLCDSYYSEEAFGSGLVELRNDNLFLRLVCDRGQYAIEVAARHLRGNKRWIPIDRVRKFLTGKECNNWKMDKENAEFLRDYCAMLTESFSRENTRQSLEAMNQK